MKRGTYLTSQFFPMNYLKTVIALYCLLQILGCATTTRMTASWSNPEFAAPRFEKIVVAGVIDNVAARRSLELEVVSELKKKGINAVPAFNVFRPGYLESNPDPTDIQLKLADNAIDGAIVLAVLDIKEEEYYVPGSTTYQPRMNYNMWWDYYYTTYNRIDNPGYYAQSTEVYVESQLYDVASGDVVWTGQSRTADPTSITDFTKSYAHSMVAKLLQDKAVSK